MTEKKESKQTTRTKHKQDTNPLNLCTDTIHYLKVNKMINSYGMSCTTNNKY